MAALVALLFAAPAPPAAATTTRIFTAAGTGAGGFSGDGGPATTAQIDGPRGVAWMPDGGFVFADFFNSRVRRVEPSGRVTTIAGTGVDGITDGGAPAPATQSKLNFVHGVAVPPDGHVLIADERNNRIRHVDLSTGLMTTVAGNGGAAYDANDDGGPATAAQIDNPRGVATTAGGAILIPDTGNNVVWEVDAHPGGTIRRVAGTGVAGDSGDGGSARSATLDRPFGVAPAANGGFLIADLGNAAVRRVWPDGTITTVAGSGQTPTGPNDVGDGGPAIQAKMYDPTAVAETPPGGPLPGGGILVTDNQGNRVRYVDPDTGIITTVVGNGLAGSAGDGGLASAGEVNGPRGLAMRPDGHFLIAEFGPPFTSTDKPPGGDRIRFVGDRALFPPAAAITSGPSGLTRSTSASFTFSASGATSGFDCRLDSAGWAPCTSPKSYAPLPDGRHTFRVRPRDSAGEAPGNEATRTWTIDSTPPDTRIGSGPGASTTSRSARVEFSATEAGAGFQCAIDSRGWTACASPKAYTGLGLGRHRVQVRARDRAGNLDGSPAARTWTVVARDSRAPRLGLRVPRTLSLRVALASGIPLRLSCSERCRVVAEARIPRSAKARTRFVRIGLRTRRLAGGRKATLRLRPSRRWRRRLRRVRRLRLSVRVTARDASGNRRSRTRRVILRRR